MASNTFEISDKSISFYEVPLVCGAAPDMGCGSRSKPVLLELQNQAAVKEAWLNRPGTVVAIVWENNIEPNINAVAAVFQKHGKPFNILQGKDYNEQYISFKSDKWYKGAAVDELSMEEAGRIAARIIDQLIEFGALAKKDAPILFRGIEAYIQNEFKILKDINLLSSPEYYERWEKDIRKIGELYLDFKGKHWRWKRLGEW